MTAHAHPAASNSTITMNSEAAQIVERYERRNNKDAEATYDLAKPSRYLAHQEKERAFLRHFGRWTKRERQEMRALEVGCGYGDNLQQFIRWGFSPKNLVGNDLLDERCEIARQQLPIDVKILAGDACALDLKPESFQVVLQSTVFTSILDDTFQKRLADRIWSLVAPGGGVLWYDFTFNNPKNPDVRGVSRQRIGELFPEATCTSQRITLAPPIARLATKIHPACYGIANSIPFLRSHIFCWLEKPA